MRPLTERLVLDRKADDMFVGRPAPEPARIYGGEVAALALAATNRTVDGDRRAHSLQAMYLRAGDASDDVEFTVERLRDGRSFSSRQVTAWQQGRPIFVALVGYHVDDDGFEHDRPMPEAPSPETLEAISSVGWVPGQAWIDWAGKQTDVEMRWVPPVLGDPSGRRLFWFRVPGTEDADGALQSALAVFVSDFTMVASIRLPHEPPDRKLYLMTTLNHTVYLHRPFESSQWHLIEHSSHVAAGSRGTSIAYLYRQDGALVATFVQEGLARRIE